MTEKFFSIKPLASPLRPGQKVLKAEDYQQLVTYEQLLNQLEKRYHQQEKAVAAALTKAITRGLEQGQEHAARQNSELMLQFAQRTDEALLKMQDELAQLVVNAVRKIVHDLDPEEKARQAVIGGLELVRGSHKLLIRVNPQVQAAVAAQLDSIAHRFSHLEVVGDAHLDLDDCILESDIGIVNANLEQQLQVIEQTLRAAL